MTEERSKKDERKKQNRGEGEDKNGRSKGREVEGYGKGSIYQSLHHTGREGWIGFPINVWRTQDERGEKGKKRKPDWRLEEKERT